MLAPEIVGINTWINSTGIQLSKLRGKPIVFCFICGSETLCKEQVGILRPLLTEYPQVQFLIIHTPSRMSERNAQTILEEVAAIKLPIPIGLDNHFLCWNKYGITSRPTLVYVDKKGMIRLLAPGLSDAKTIRKNIELLMDENV